MKNKLINCTLIHHMGYNDHHVRFVSNYYSVLKAHANHLNVSYQFINL
jgi:hypothetical protein